MVEVILGALLLAFVLLYLLDYLGVLNFLSPFYEIFRLLFRGLRWIVSGLARALRSAIQRHDGDGKLR